MESERLLKEFLAKHEILYEEIEHPPLFTCDDWKNYGLPPLEGSDTKNLFLSDENRNLYLLTTECRKKVKLNEIRKELGLKKLSFGKEEDMIRTLGVRPGSVTSLGLIFDLKREVNLILDRDVMESEVIQTHPCRNDKTILVTKNSYKRFLEILGIHPRIVTIL